MPQETTDNDDLFKFNILPKYVAIVGSRNFPRLDAVEKFVQRVPEDTVIVSGGAWGVDKRAEKAAIARSLPPSVILIPEWDKFGIVAGVLRNVEIAQYLVSKKPNSYLVSFVLESVPGQYTPGSSDMLEKARSLRIPHTIFSWVAWDNTTGPRWKKIQEWYDWTPIAVEKRSV